MEKSLVLTNKEAELLKEVPESLKLPLYNEWKEFAKIRKWNNYTEKSKAMETYFLGAMIALHYTKQLS